jgi:hypothetical protein
MVAHHEGGQHQGRMTPFYPAEDSLGQGQECGA